MREGLPHIVVSGFNAKGPFKPKGRGRNPLVPVQDRTAHGAFIQNAYREAVDQGILRKEAEVPLTEDTGIYLKIKGVPNCQLQLDSLDTKKSYRLQSWHMEGDSEVAVIFVPDNKRNDLAGKIEAYLNPAKDVINEKENTSNPKNRRLIDSIQEIRLADLSSFWTDKPHLFPANSTEVIWWEVWLNWKDNQGSPLALARDIGERLGAEISSSYLTFFKSAVFLIKCTAEQLARVPELIGNLSELRRAQASPNLSITLSPTDQQDLATDLQGRVTLNRNSTASICVLDTGVNYNNPLLSVVCSARNSECWNATWPHFDNYAPASPYNDHGSKQAGVILYGQHLQELLFSNNPVECTYHIESARIFPPTGRNDPQLYGAVTVDTANKIEIQNPNWNRAYSLAVTAVPSGPTGQPSSWSAEIDYYCSGYLDDKQRLFIISAGNNSALRPDLDYWDQVNNAEIEDPAQAWNSITVGASTFLTEVDDPTFGGWSPFAHPGDVAPSSRSSVSWEWRRQAPYKPEVVAEGGNRLLSPDQTEVSDADCVSILTTSGRTAGLVLETTRDTSSACAVVSKEAGLLLAEYPNYWPETIRGLLVHSASWTDRMYERYGLLLKSHTRGNAKEIMLRTVGYGIIDTQKARHSADNLLTLISQETIKPFIKERGKENSATDAKLNEMVLYELPWPEEVLQSLGHQNVKLKVTLSYYIEPNPGRKGYRSRYTYQSHGLRFEVIRPDQSLQNFKNFINGLASQDDEEYDGPEGDNSGWFFGPALRKRGSVHTDTWTGDAAQLASMNYIAVYPVGGWWKHKTSDNCWKKTARFSLIVTIETPEVEVDIYTPVQNIVELQIEV